MIITFRNSQLTSLHPSLNITSYIQNIACFWLQPGIQKLFTFTCICQHQRW